MLLNSLHVHATISSYLRVSLVCHTLLSLDNICHVLVIVSIIIIVGHDIKQVRHTNNKQTSSLRPSTKMEARTGLMS